MSSEIEDYFASLDLGGILITNRSSRPQSDTGKCQAMLPSGAGISLDFSTKESGGRKSNFSVDAFVINERGEVVIHNMRTIPTTKETWLQ